MDYDRLAFIERLVANEWERLARSDVSWDGKDDRDIMGEFAREWYEELEKLEEWLKEQDASKTEECDRCGCVDIDHCYSNGCQSE